MNSAAVTAAPSSMAHRSGTSASSPLSRDDPRVREIRALLGAGQLDAADERISTLLDAAGDHPYAWDLRGVVAHMRGDHRMARSHTRRAIHLKEDETDFHEHMALYLHLLARPADAIESARRALALLEQPRESSAGSAIRRAALHDLWGRMARIYGELDTAVEQHEMACTLDPDRLGYASNLAIACAEHPDHGARGLTRIRDLTRQAPDDAEFHFNRGIIERKIGGSTDALDAFNRTLELMPTHAGAAMELATLQERSGAPEEADATLSALLTRIPEAHDVRFNRGLLRLRSHSWESGFLDFEARYHMPDIPTPRVPAPRWIHPDDPVSEDDGRACVREIKGRDLLVIAEQGLGDTLQFSRFCARVREEFQPASICLQVHPRLQPLLEGLTGIDRTASLKAPLPSHDVWTGAMSLPLLSRAARDGDFRQPPCFAPSEDRRARW
ncbi:MAG: tetratricopeptide repeat protein, partial [Nannocystaceae bacterium]